MLESEVVANDEERKILIVKVILIQYFISLNHFLELFQTVFHDFFG